MHRNTELDREVSILLKSNCLLAGEFDPLTLNVNTDREGLAYAVQLFVFCLSNDFCSSIPPLLFFFLNNREGLIFCSVPLQLTSTFLFYISWKLFS